MTLKGLRAERKRLLQVERRAVRALTKLKEKLQLTEDQLLLNAVLKRDAEIYLSLSPSERKTSSYPRMYSKLAELEAEEEERKRRRGARKSNRVRVILPRDVSGWYVPEGYAGPATVVSEDEGRTYVRWIGGPGNRKEEPVDSECVVRDPA